MARADLLLELVRAGARGEQSLFRKALEALIAEERAKQHNILAERLAGYLNQIESAKPGSTPAFRNGLATNLFHEINPTRRMEDLVLSDVITTACLKFYFINLKSPSCIFKEEKCEGISIWTVH